MKNRISQSPGAETRSGPVITHSGGLTSATTKELQKWFRQTDNADAGEPGVELRNWEEALHRTHQKWEGGATLSEAEVRFLVEGFTAIYDTPEDFFGFVWGICG